MNPQPEHSRYHNFRQVFSYTSLTRRLEEGKSFMQNNLSRRSQITLAAGIMGGVVVVPILAPPVLGLVGFSATGPVAGSLAAGIQAGIGNVVAGSAFASTQAVAMGASVPFIGQAIGGGLIAGTTYIAGGFRRGTRDSGVARSSKD